MRTTRQLPPRRSTHWPRRRKDVTIDRGIVLVRTGRVGPAIREGNSYSLEGFTYASPGTLREVRRLARHGKIAAVAADNVAVETTSPEGADMMMPLHMICQRMPGFRSANSLTSKRYQTACGIGEMGFSSRRTSAADNRGGRIAGKPPRHPLITVKSAGDPLFATPGRRTVRLTFEGKVAIVTGAGRGLGRAQSPSWGDEAPRSS